MTAERLGDVAATGLCSWTTFAVYKRCHGVRRCMNVSDAMTPRSDLVVVEIPGSRSDVLEYIQEYGFSSVPVVKDVDGDEVYRGLVTRDDLIEQPDEDQLALLMREVPTVGADGDMIDAARTMVAEESRRLPVVDGDELVGILTVTDVVRAIARGEVDGETPVGELATRAVNATHAETPLPVAEREIALSGVPYAVVLDGDAAVTGMLTEVDILEVARVVEGEASTGDSIAEEDSEWSWEGIKATGARYLPTRNVEIPAEDVRHFMTDDLITVNATRTAKEVAQELISNDIEQVPLVSGTELDGIVRDVDLLEGL
jgi:CBS domain-containing protein